MVEILHFQNNNTVELRKDAHPRASSSKKRDSEHSNKVQVYFKVEHGARRSSEDGVAESFYHSQHRSSCTIQSAGW